MGLIQIDSVNVLVRSQELPLFARLGPHPRSLIADATAAGELFEYWVHEASHVPTEHHHLHRWRMAQDHKWSRYWDLTQRRPGYIEEVLRRIEVDGPVAAGDLSERVGKKGTWWDWDDAKVALEHLFWNGERHRHPPAQRLRPHLRPHRTRHPRARARPPRTPPSGGAQGVARCWPRGTTAWPRSPTSPTTTGRRTRRAGRCVDELVEEGTLLPVQVEGWDKPAYLHPERTAAAAHRRRARCSARSIPVCWNRERTERLFGFHYRIEIYTPAPKRVYGYYVLPVLWGDSLVGRLDMKADRAKRRCCSCRARSPSRACRTGRGGSRRGRRAARRWRSGWGSTRSSVADRGDLAPALRGCLTPG